MTMHDFTGSQSDKNDFGRNIHVSRIEKKATVARGIIFSCMYITRTSNLLRLDMYDLLKGLKILDQCAKQYTVLFKGIVHIDQVFFTLLNHT